MANHYTFTRIKDPLLVASGRRIAAARKAKGWSQEELKKACGFTGEASRIGNYEQGTREIDVRTALALAKALDMHVAYLLGLIDEVDRDILQYPLETKMHFLSALRAAAPQKTR